jgi:hypothetical protein
MVLASKSSRCQFSCGDRRIDFQLRQRAGRNSGNVHRWHKQNEEQDCDDNTSDQNFDKRYSTIPIRFLRWLFIAFDLLLRRLVGVL